MGFDVHWDAHPGELLHLGLEKLGRFHRPGHRVTGDRQLGSRGAGWEDVHVAVDDASRVGYTAIHPDASGRSAYRFLVAALRYYRSLRVAIRCVLTDNGACYSSRRFQRLCRRLQLKHLRTQP
jgi:transposase InsO family protein